MANLARVRTLWTGNPVIGDGVSTFYFDEAHTGFVADVGTFWNSQKASFPAGITWTTPGSGDLIDVATGELSGTWTEAGTSAITSTGPGIFARGVGVRTIWRTSGIRNGRRVQGSTFLAPLVGAMFEADGSPAAAQLTLWRNTAATLVTDSGTNMKIYSRPSPGQAGQANTVISSDVPDKVSWLRSRRV